MCRTHCRTHNRNHSGLLPVGGSYSADASSSAVVLTSSSPAALDDLHLEDHATRLYSIRVPSSIEEVRCHLCQLEFLAVGPTGFLGEDSICDACLLTGCQELGMLLALASVTRTFASFKGASREEYSEALAELAAFARIYDRVTSRSGPSRAFKIPEFEN